MFSIDYFDGFVQDCSSSIANALDILQSCNKPSICYNRWGNTKEVLPVSERIGFPSLALTHRCYDALLRVPCNLGYIPPKLVLRSNPARSLYQIVMKFCTEHGSITAVLCAKLQNDLTLLWILETNEISRDVGLRWVMSFKTMSYIATVPAQRTHDVMITSLLRQNDVAMSFWRNNEIIITPCVRWQVI